MKKLVKWITISFLSILLITSFVFLLIEIDVNKKLNQTLKNNKKEIININESIKENDSTIAVVNTNINGLKEANIKKVKLLEKWKRQNEKVKTLLN